MQLEWKNLSYAQIISTVQYLYIPIDITIFESLVLAYRKNETESYLEFSSRAFRHLKLCSRLQPVGQRERYIEDRRVKILKNNLPQTVLDEILKKEMIFQNFSSTEILDHMISYCHKEKGSINQFDHFF